MNSMTGFGRASLGKEEKEYLIEIKAVNHKYSDISVKAPRNLMAFEDKIRRTVLNKISRGKIDIYITYSNLGANAKKVVINKALAKQYIGELKEVAEENEIDSNIKVIEISKLPDVLNIEEIEDEGSILEGLLECLNIALDKLIQMRHEEGTRIKQDLSNRILKVEEIVHQISEDSSGLIQNYIVKLENRIREILQTEVVDQNRLAQEIVIYSDKCSVEEELTRLESHIAQFKELICKEGPVGKKLDFLMQINLNSLTFAIIIGMIIGNLFLKYIPKSFRYGITFSAKKLLRLAIILYGFRITFQQIFAVGGYGLVADIIMLSTTYLIGYYLGTRVFKLDKDLCMLTAIGSSVCGAAAVLGTDSMLKAKSHKVSLAVSTVVFLD